MTSSNRRQRRDHRTFVAIDHHMPDHPKVVGLSDTGFRAFIEAICYCSRYETDGKVPASAMRKLGGPTAMTELEDAGLLVPDEGSFRVHDYLDFQRSAEEINEIREKRRAAGSAGGKAKAAAVAGAKQMPEVAASKSPGKTASEIYPETETETETDRARESSSSKPAPRRGHRLPPSWKPSEQDVGWSRARGIPDAYARRETEKFTDHWAAATGQSAVKLDWSAAWRNWIRTAAERNPPTAPSGGEGGHTPW